MEALYIMRTYWLGKTTVSIIQNCFILLHFDTFESSHSMMLLLHLLKRKCQISNLTPSL